MTGTNSDKGGMKRSSMTLVVLILTLVAPFVAMAEESSDGNRSQRTVLVSIADRQLAVLEDGDVIAQFPVAVGASVSPSPTGEFEIVSRVENPTYYRPGVVIPTGKDNPVGTRWIGLDLKGYGIHGTNVPQSIGHAASHGCIRLRNRDVEKLFSMLQVGDAVEIRGERDEETSDIFGGDVDDATVASADAGPADGQ